MKKFVMCLFVVMISLSSASAKRNVVEFEGHKIRFPKNMYHRMYEKDIKENKPFIKEDVIDPRIFDLKDTVPIPWYYDSIKSNELRNLA